MKSGHADNHDLERIARKNKSRNAEPFLSLSFSHLQELQVSPIRLFKYRYWREKFAFSQFFSDFRSSKT